MISSSRFASALVFLIVVPAIAGAVDLDWDPGRGVRVHEGNDWGLRVGARIQVDTAHYDAALDRLGDGSRLRRARAYADMDLGRRWSAFVDHEFGEVSPGFKNAFMEYRAGRHTRVRVGQFKPGLGLESSMSSGDLPFMERSVASELAPGFLTGAGVKHWSDAWSASLNFFGNDVHGRDERGLGGKGMQLRVAGFRELGGAVRLHAGAGYERRSLDRGATVRLRPRPESAVTDGRLLNSGRLRGVAHSHAGALELGVQAGSLLAYGERLKLRLSGDSFGTRDADGWQASLLWAVTGEHRRYSRTRGAFSGLAPRHDFGALEIAARTGRLEVPLAGGTRARERHTTLGLSWTCDEYARVSLEHSWLAVSPIAASPALKGGITQVRLQMSF